MIVPGDPDKAPPHPLSEAPTGSGPTINLYRITTLNSTISDYACCIFDRTLHIQSLTLLHLCSSHVAYLVADISLSRNCIEIIFRFCYYAVLVGIPESAKLLAP
jgi:hypothetical protein